MIALNSSYTKVFHVLYSICRLIRLTSPNLNYLLIVGTLLMYTSGIVFLLPTRNPQVMRASCFVSSMHCV